MPSTYLNFDLLISPTTTAYEARVIASPAGQASAPFVLPFSATELQRFTWITARHLRHARLKPPAGAPPPLNAQRFGTLLFDALFDGPLGRLWARSLTVAEQQGHGLRLRLRLAEVAELAALPWEYLYSSDLARFLVLSDRTPLVRYLDQPLAEQTLTVDGPLTILTVLAAPRDLPALQLAHEWTQLEQALAPLAAQGRVHLERLPKADLPTLQQRLRQGDIHILHFMGHGDFGDAGDESHAAEESTAAQGMLAFENAAGKAQLVSGAQLGTLLHDHEALRLVFLNACKGAQGAAANTFAGVAQTLVQQGIPAVLAMQFAVSDNAAIALATEFYRTITDGYGVDAAVSEARKALSISSATGIAFPEWGTPVLFTRASDGRLLQTKPTAAAQEVVGPPIDGDGRDTIAVNITGSEFHGSSINIQQGRPSQQRSKRSNEEASDLDSAMPAQPSRSAVGKQLTEQEGELRRRYRQIIALEDQLLLGDDGTEKAQLVAAIETQLAALATLLRPYATTAHQQHWPIPQDLQAALDRIAD